MLIWFEILNCLHALTFVLSGVSVVPVQMCQREDIVFVVDSSGSIQGTNWPLVLEFMKNVIRGFNIGPDAVRIGVVSFGNLVYPQFQLNTFFTLEDILGRIDRIQFMDQSTNTPAAIRYTREVMFTARNGDRPFVPNSAIIITDGVPRVPSDLNQALRLTFQEANLARQQGINIFAIGVGPEITQSSLNQIANQPSSQYTFKVDQYQQLESILYEVASAACGDTVTIPPLPGKGWEFARCPKSTPPACEQLIATFCFFSMVSVSVLCSQNQCQAAVDKWTSPLS